MSYQVSLPDSNDRKTLYQAIVPQLRSVLSDESDPIANMANVSSLLKEVFDFWWVGFYRNIDGILVLGPFQGPLACTRIPNGKGVCGAAMMKKETLVVPDVDAFPGHIACSSASRSEIVVPGIVGGEVVFVLDVDSDTLDDFSEVDRVYLEEIVALLLGKD